MVRCKTELNEEVMNKSIELSLQEKPNGRKRRNTACILGTVGLMYIIWGVLACINNSSGSGKFMLVLGIIVMVLVLNLKRIQKLSLKKMQNQMDPAFCSGTSEYIFDEDGIHIQNHMGESMNHWSAFKAYGTTGEYLYIKRGDNRVVMVNQNDLSQEELQELRQLLEKNVAFEK